MGEFFLDSEKVRIDFPDKNWVDVKAELTQEDQDYILDQMASASYDGKTQASISIGKGRLALLERTIIAWSFPEPVTRENISRLRLKYRSKVLDEVGRLNEEAREFVSKNV